jgi:hypothetical protein
VRRARHRPGTTVGRSWPARPPQIPLRSMASSPPRRRTTSPDQADSMPGADHVQHYPAEQQAGQSAASAEIRGAARRTAVQRGRSSAVSSASTTPPRSRLRKPAAQGHTSNLERYTVRAHRSGLRGHPSHSPAAACRDTVNTAILCRWRLPKRRCGRLLAACGGRPGQASVNA